MLAAGPQMAAPGVRGHVGVAEDAVRAGRVPGLLLQSADLLAQRGVGDAETGGGMTEVWFLGEHEEGAQLRQRVFRAVPVPRDISSSRSPY
ncbi:hypothetical protein ABB07_01995 [Streptomyces incarnatus]|uniref:Uncharacterized protein n=1 Tax=Streptomyces incarnatus TaxID=665007 RepID=A0ABM5TDF6_9ACTN|nr:hypothetical protein ABB07_01995 [Streptomyces incarnatus]